MNAISTIRRRLDMTQAAFAAEIGVTQSMVSHYERGAEPTITTARRILVLARERGVETTLDELFATPELIGTEGSPPIAANAEPIGAGEVRDAA